MKKQNRRSELSSLSRLACLSAFLVALSTLAGCSSEDWVVAPLSDDVRAADVTQAMILNSIRDLRVGMVDPTIVQIHWTAPEVRPGYPSNAAAHYRVFYEAVESTDSAAEARDLDLRPRPGGRPEQCLFVGLNPGTSYRLWLRAYDAGWISSTKSNVVQFETPEQPTFPSGDHELPTDQG